MSGLVMPRWRGGVRHGAKIVGGALAVMMTAGLLSTSLPSSHAATGTGTVTATFSNTVPFGPFNGSQPVSGVMTPNTVYGQNSTPTGAAFQYVKLSAGRF